MSGKSKTRHRHSAVSWEKRAVSALAELGRQKARHARGEPLPAPRPTLSADEASCYICLKRKARFPNKTKMRCSRCSKPICSSHAVGREGGKEVHCGKCS